MKTLFTFFLLLLFFAIDSNSQTWTNILNDQAGDGLNKTLPEGSKLDFYFDQSHDSIWFKFYLNGIQNKTSINLGLNIMIKDPNIVESFQFWGFSNNKDTFSKLISVFVTGQTPTSLTGIIGIADAKGINAAAKIFTNLFENNINVIINQDEQTAIIGLKRKDLIPDISLNTSLKIAAAVGSSVSWNDDLYTNTATIKIPKVVSKSYCIPPKYTTGPYTAISRVKLDKMDNKSKIDDGYKDFTTTNTQINLIQGNEDSLFVEFYYDPSLLSVFSGDINFRVWIDWNEDYDFDDEGEEVVKAVVNCSKVTNVNPNIQYSTKIKIPANALIGNTRMRIYEDMIDSDGHESPGPCGYLNSTNDVGQHGECEDYQINVKSSTDIEDTNYDKPNFVIFPNPIKDGFINLSTLGNYYITDINGRVLIEEINTTKLDISNLSNGTYFIFDTNKSKQKLIINR